MNGRWGIALGALLVGGCCGGHSRASNDDQPKVERAETSPVVKADPSRIKSVKTVALASVVASCDVVDHSASAGGKRGVFSAISTMKNLEETRAPASLDVSITPFSTELASDTGWTLLPAQQVLSNPAYSAQTFDPDLHVQMRQIRKAFCTGSGMRVLTADYSPKAAELAKTLGVDAVALVMVQLSVKSGYAKNDGLYMVAVNGDLALIGPDGQLIYRDVSGEILQDMFIGYDPVTNKYGLKGDLLVGLDWKQVPKYSISAMQNLAKKFGADVKRTTAQQ